MVLCLPLFISGFRCVEYFYKIMSDRFFTHCSGVIACFDIGGTKVAVSLFANAYDAMTLPLKVLRLSEPTVKMGDRNALSAQIIRLLVEACRCASIDISNLLAIGISSCGPFIQGDEGILLVGPNLCGGLGCSDHGLPNNWRSIPLEKPLRLAIGCDIPLRIENDCIAALEAERRWGALYGFNSCAYLTWSTGIGVGLCVDGYVLRGKNGNAGHAGHSYVSDCGIGVCGCGNTGDVESLVSGRSILRSLGYGAEDLMAAAKRGDANAVDEVDKICGLLARLLYNLTVTLDLERISIGGSVFLRNSDYLLPKLKRQLERRSSVLMLSIELVVAGLGEQVGDYAALALVNR